ncbi:uncharacterized protein LOC128458960 isoform X1 [Pleuronectes platessa]|uniref:uncharacterized protein LOC128458960 isoform X1 n=1 Tax=Pleuronectes platessa TaxID=8262 RepID=UPI00232A11E1|nr:uncharacterized protein LOC128458960 isoform X1 [Pleuronectes platessa]XP_053300008.1 uncharacterized protein LOC128458960 isoform X1 [Pleuronectes platessa]
MSVLSVVEQAIKSCKAEQTRIHDSIQFYRELLHSLAPHHTSSFEETEHSDAAVEDTDTSPGEKEDIELLEQALEKALRIRTSSGASVKDQDGKKPARPLKDVASFKGGRTTIGPTSKLASLDRKEHKKPVSSVSSTQGSRPSASIDPGKSTIKPNNRSTIQKLPVSSAEVLHHQAVRKLRQAASASGGRISTSHSKNRTIKSSVLSGGDPGKAAAISAPPSNNTLPFPHTHKAAAHGLPRRDGKTSEQITKWKSLRNKQNRLAQFDLWIWLEYHAWLHSFSLTLGFFLRVILRLWDKVVALQRNPVPGRSHFMERMRDMFPDDSPCGSTDPTGALADKLTHRGLHLTHHCQTNELLAKPTPEATVVNELETRDRWRPEGGGLPLTITYTTEAELREVEMLRMWVALLQQELSFEQALSDTLSPQLVSIAPGPGCPSASVLRDMYSLLGEGGQRFPATVLDCEPD